MIFLQSTFRLLVEIVSGTTMDDFGNIHILDSRTWNDRREQYLKVAQEHFINCQFKAANLYELQKKVWGMSKTELEAPH